LVEGLRKAVQVDRGLAVASAYVVDHPVTVFQVKFTGDIMV
jgi:hypothetical protein